MVRVVLDAGQYGYVVDTDPPIRDFFGGDSWRDRETAIAYCESAAHSVVDRRIGPVKVWSVR